MDDFYDDLANALNQSLIDYNNQNNNIETLSFEQQIAMASNLSFKESFGKEYNHTCKNKIKKNINNDDIPFKKPIKYIEPMKDSLDNQLAFIKVLYPCCNKYYMNYVEHNVNENHEADLKVNLMKCLYCNYKQDINYNCINCNKRVANYICKKCNVFTFNNQHVHCNICKKCVKHKKHCSKCNICHEPNVNCEIANKKASSICSICCSDVNQPSYVGSKFTSSEIYKLKCCGNYIHLNCIVDFFSQTQDNKCPYCREITSIN